MTYSFNHAVTLYKLSNNAATGIALNDSYSMNASKGELKITPNFTPKDANKYTIRWTLKSADKFKVKEKTAYTKYDATKKTSGEKDTIVYTKNEALDLVATAAQAGDSVDITAQLIDADGLVAATAKTTVKYVIGFDDVQNKYDYAYDAITYMSNEQTVSVDGKDAKIAVINGVGDNKFNPDGNVTRAQFITFLYRADQTIENREKTITAKLADASPNVKNAYLQDTDTTGRPAKQAEFTLDDGSKRTLYYSDKYKNKEASYVYKTYATAKAQTKFTDVSAGAYYAKAVDWAVANGIAAGKTATTFDPNAAVTRAEAVTFLQRYYAAGQKYNVSSKFADVKSTDFFASAVGWATSNGVTQGKDDTHFAPKDTCSRKEAAAFIFRANRNAKINK